MYQKIVMDLLVPEIAANLKVSVSTVYRVMTRFLQLEVWLQARGIVGIMALAFQKNKNLIS